MGISVLLFRKRREVVRTCREARSPAVSVCILLLRLLKSLLFIQQEDLATSFPFCELCALSRCFVFVFVFASVVQQCILGSDFSKVHQEVPFFVTVVCR